MEISINTFSPAFIFEFSFSMGWLQIDLFFFTLLIVSDKLAKELEKM